MRISDWSSDVCSSDLRQIAGEVEVDVALLEKRCLAIAACIEEEVGQPALHLHPHDIALMASKNLPVRLLADEEMLRGSVRLETSDGWVEDGRSEEHTSELQSLMRISYAVFCLKKKKKHTNIAYNNQTDKLHNLSHG